MDVTHCQNKEYPHVLSHDAAINACRWGGGAVDTEWETARLDHVCPCPVLGLAQQRSAPCVAQARGLLSVY